MRSSLLPLGLALSCFATAALAEAPSLTVTAQVQEEVSPDHMRVTLAVERTGKDLGGLNRQVLELTNQLLQQAKAPGVQAVLDGVSTAQAYDNGKRQGWVVRSQVLVEGKDFAQVAAVTSRLSSSWELASVTFGLSPALREKVQVSLRDKLGQSFREKAQGMAQALGFKRIQIQAVTLDEAEAPVYMERAASVRMLSSAAADVPTQAAKETVTVRLSGSVLLLP